MLIPRGRYNFEMYDTLLKIHGKTHDYKIKYSQINRAFVLPKPDLVHYAYVLALNSAVRIGQKDHHFLCMQFKKDQDITVKLNLDEGEIKKRYGDDLTTEIEGPLFDVLSRLLKSIVGCSIIVPDGFKAHKGAAAIKCSAKAQDGYLFPLTKSLLFIHKPVSYTEHKDISHIELARIQEF